MTRQHLSFQNIGLVYLGSPFVLFHLFWLELWFSIPTLVALLIAFWFTQPRRAEYKVESRSVSLRVILSGAPIAIIWVFFAGYFGVVFGLTPDWNDLRADLYSTFVQFSWPVSFSEVGGGEERFLLSTPGFYLAPAAISKILGLSGTLAQCVMASWMLAGIALVFGCIMQKFSRVAEQVTALLIFVMFSGLDSIGALLTQDDSVEYLLTGGHLEPWSGTIQFSSSTTLLFWVPHHALSSWVGVAILDRARNTSKFVGVTILSVALIYLWSPFSAIGLILVAIVMFGIDRKAKLTDFVGAIPLSVIAAVALVPVHAYYARQVWVPRELWWYFSERAFINFGIEEIVRADIVLRYALFIILEFGIWLAIGFVLKVSKLELALVGVVLVLVSQVVSFGPSDFTMRVSIAPMFLLLMLLLSPITELIAKEGRTILKAAVILVLVVMSWTAVTEVIENYRRGPNTIQAPCVLGGCDSSLTPLEDGYSVTSPKPLLFRD